MPAPVPIAKKLIKQVPVRITAEMRMKLKMAARKNYIPMAEYVRRVLHKHLERLK